MPSPTDPPAGELALAEARIAALQQELLATQQQRDALRAETSRALRTPLSTILGYTEMLVEEAEERGIKGFVPDLLNIRAACDDLLAFVEGASVPPPFAEGAAAELPAALIDTTPMAGRRR